MRRTKVAQIYRKTGDLRAIQLLHGHTKMDRKVRYLGVDLEDTLAISESIEIQNLGPAIAPARSRHAIEKTKASKGRKADLRCATH